MSEKVKGLAYLVANSTKHQCFCRDGYCLDNFPEILRKGCPNDPELKPRPQRPALDTADAQADDPDS